MLIAGARPNFMKIAPIIRELEKHADRFDYRLVHTGQHYDREMSDVFFEELEIPKPHYHLEVGSGSHAEQTAKIMVKFEQVCANDLPDIVMVVGDVNSTLACAIVAKKLGVQVAHVEAGLRSGDMGMPEEINRIVTDSITDLFFVTEQSGVDNLLKEGKPKENIHFVGHVMIDNLFYQVRKLKKIDTSVFPSNALKEKYRDYGVVTLHRPSNVDEPNVLEGILGALMNISRELPLIFSVHPRTAKNIEKFDINLPDEIVVTTSLPYMEFLNLWKDAKVVFTDSGGLQEETTALGVQCVTIRQNTERPITVEEGTNTVVGIDPEAIMGVVAELDGRSDVRRASRPKMWDGSSATRIVEVIG